jgi:NADH-quinone oxidoreductase subunit L
MGGLRTKMPVTFWTFLIGGFALAGFPFITAGFWSKDEILLDAFTHAPIVFWMLALAALLTAFYTMRQITMTFFGKPRTQAAAHASENTWTMTAPLVILSVFAIGAGWLNIPEDFPVFGPLAHSLNIAGWFHEKLGGALLEHPAALAFNWVPLTTSLVVALGGLLLGWLVYRNAYKTADDRDPAQVLGAMHTVLKNKYYMDELYDRVFVRPAMWISETVVSLWIDRGAIDGFLHTVARAAFALGHVFRDDFEKPVINNGPDYLANGIQLFGREIKVIQTGKIQQYLLFGMLVMMAAGVVVLWPFIR